MIIIKRYSNRKLYDMEARQYVSLKDIGEMVREDKDIKIVDHNSGTNLTGLTLMQVLFEEERKIGGLLPQVIVKRLIRGGSRSLESLRSSLSAFISPLEMVEDEIVKRLDTLLSEEAITKKEHTRFRNLLLGAQWHEREPQNIEEPVENHSANIDEMSALMDQVKALENAIEKLSLKNNEVE